jgi:endonuclease/exonuclease/phosphatase family metal-dependent hydrolase
MSRISAVVDAIAKENPAVYLGQEFENLGAQDKCIRLMRKKGFHYFLRDLGANDAIRNNSGLFVASQVPLQNVQFIPYPLEDRAGLAKWSGQGALTFTVPVQGKDLRLVNVHLNYGEGPENQNARNRQLTRHVVPLLKQGNAALFGDLNFNTALVDQAASGLLGYVNALEGKVTCTDEGKHTLRGKSRTLDGKPCADCEEKIDGLIYNPNRIQVLSSKTQPLLFKEQLLSDHFATVATLNIRNSVSV